ncbi:MAG: cysteine desulfurase [Planctomycetes bacterium]|nr:cysteine desulfurase [Planctomycetota bacterium]
MSDRRIYLDNHATTRVDPRVVEAMLPFFTEHYGNAGSTSHWMGWDAQAAVDEARTSIARILNASPKEIVFTSGATESNNLAIRGVAERVRRRGNHLVLLATEHKSVLDPIAKLARRGFEVTFAPLVPAGQADAGRFRTEQFVELLRDDTLLVTVMLANNEIGVVQSLSELAQLCRQRGILVHTDATQAVGKLPVDVRQLGVDLLSFNGHKIHGPKGIGGLYVRRSTPPVRIEPQIDGGGQEFGFRSGTCPVPLVVGLARALELSQKELETEAIRQAGLRNRLFADLCDRIPDCALNGPALEPPGLRLPGNLNCSFGGVDGEALMMSMRDLAVSSGSACTSTNPEPSHVLRALGVPDDRVRASLRFGLSRFTTEAEIDQAIEIVADSVRRLRSLIGR